MIIIFSVDIFSITNDIYILRSVLIFDKLLATIGGKINFKVNHS